MNKPIESWSPAQLESEWLLIKQKKSKLSHNKRSEVGRALFKVIQSNLRSDHKKHIKSHIKLYIERISNIKWEDRQLLKFTYEMIDKDVEKDHYVYEIRLVNGMYCGKVIIEKTKSVWVDE